MQLNMGLQPQRDGQGLDLFPPAGVEAGPHDRALVRRALTWECRRGSMSFPSTRDMLTLARLAATGACPDRAVDAIGALPA
eukprot:6695087-Pyramimonas_sp.AAC.1